MSRDLYYKPLCRHLLSGISWKPFLGFFFPINIIYVYSPTFDGKYFASSEYLGKFSDLGKIILKTGLFNFSYCCKSK
jgi:hypothetical protein